MAVGYARPSVSSLHFRLYGRSIHPELFQVYAETDVRQPRFSAVVRICDAGHTVAFRRSERIITEVTAGRDQPLPNRKRLLERRLCGSRDESIRFDDGLNYHASYQLERVDAEVFQNIHEELLRDCCHAELSHRFPPGNRLAPGPISLIRVDADAGSLLVHAFHTFPEACAVVKTQSLFEL